MKIMDKKEKNDLIEQLEYEISKKLLHLYEQKLYEQAERIRELEERLNKLEEAFLWAAHDLNV